jgi:hypothetical protein
MNLPREEVVKSLRQRYRWANRLTTIEDVVEYVFYLVAEGEYITGQLSILPRPGSALIRRDEPFYNGVLPRYKMKNRQHSY